MTSSARRIESFVPGSDTPRPASEEPKFLRHLLIMPLTDGKEAMVDPDKVVSVSPHRHEEGVTVIRQEDDTYTYFVNRPYSVVKEWIRIAD